MEWHLIGILAIVVIYNIYRYYHEDDDNDYCPVDTKTTSIDQAKEIVLKIPLKDFDKNKEEYEMTLYDRWAEEKELSQNTLADTTDFFIRASIPGFSNDPVYFVRDKDGGWSSIDTTDIFMSGTLILPEQIEE